MVYFTADTHFGHINILKYQNRPFDDIYHMDQVLIQRWNDVVSENDIIYHLGDFALPYQADNTHWRKYQRYFEQLNGELIIIKGNHDRYLYKEINNGKFCTKSGEIYFHNEFYLKLKTNDGYLFLTHKPLHPGLCKKVNDSNAIFLHGHMHGAGVNLPPNYYDVGVDCNDFIPISRGYICKTVEERTRSGELLRE